MAKRVWLSCSDFIFTSKIIETARHTKAEVISLRGLDGLGSHPPADLYLVDLDAKGFDPIAAIQAARAASPALAIVAFVQHERVDQVRAARDAGASRILSRGAFSERLPALLQSGA